MKASIGTPAGSIPGVVERRVVGRGDGEARVRMRRLGAGLLGDLRASSPGPASRSGAPAASSVMPSHQTSPSSVSATLVKITSRFRLAMQFGLVLLVGARGDAEVAGLGVDRVQPAVLARLDPGDVVADRRHLPARRAPAAGSASRSWSCRRRSGRPRRRGASCPRARSRRGSACARRASRLPAPCRPRPAHRRGDAQREALLAEQRVAAVARAVAPDLLRLGVVDDVLGRRCTARPRPSRPAPAARRRCACRARSGRRRRARRAPSRPMRVIIFMLTAT